MPKNAAKDKNVAKDKDTPVPKQNNNVKLWPIKCQGITLTHLNDDNDRYTRLSSSDRCENTGTNHNGEQALYATGHTAIRLVQKGEYKLNEGSNGTKGPKRCLACQAWYDSSGAKASATRTTGFTILRKMAVNLKQIEDTLNEVGDQLDHNEYENLVTMRDDIANRKAEMILQKPEWGEKLASIGLQ